MLSDLSRDFRRALRALFRAPTFAITVIATLSLGAVERPQLLRDVLNRTLGRQRMMATLVGLFAAIALILAVLGLYGVMAQAATQRTREIAVRLAVGAEPASIVTLLLQRGLRLLGVGTAIGLGGALLVTRYIEAQLFGVTATDPLTFVSGGVLLAIAGLVASVILHSAH